MQLATSRPGRTQADLEANQGTTSRHDSSFYLGSPVAACCGPAGPRLLSRQKSLGRVFLCGFDRNRPRASSPQPGLAEPPASAAPRLRLGWGFCGPRGGRSSFPRLVSARIGTSHTPPRTSVLSFAVTLFRVGSALDKTNCGFLPPTRSRPRVGLVARCGDLAL